MVLGAWGTATSMSKEGRILKVPGSSLLFVS